MSLLEIEAGDDPVLRKFYKDWVHNLAVYLLEYVFPPSFRSRFADLKLRNLKVTRDYFLKPSRLRKPLWTHKYLESGAFGRNSADMMLGLNYNVAVIADR